MEEELIINAKVEGAQKAEKDLDGIAKKTNKADKASEDYSNTLEDGAKNLKFFGVSLGSLTSGFKAATLGVKASVMSLKSLRVALIASGIGAFVVVMGSLVAAFESTEEGQNKFIKLTNAIGVIVGNLSDVLAAFGEQVINLFTNWEFDIDKVTDALDNLVNKTWEEVEASNALSDSIAQTVKDERALLVERARLESSIAKLRFKSKQEDQFTASERLKFLNEANDLQQSLIEKELKIAQARLKEVRERNTFSKSNKAALDAEAQAQAKIFQLETARFNQARTIERERQTIGRQAVAARQMEILELGRIEIETSDKVAKEIIKNKKEIAQIDASTTQFAINNADEELANAVLVSDAANKLTNDTSASGKAIAISSTLIATLAAAVNAFKDTKGGVVIKAIAAAGATAFGLASVAKMRNTPIPKAAQGMLVGNSHANGGINIEAEGGEAIINKQSMANPNLRAMASAINVAGGGIPFFQDGGIVPNASLNPFMNLEQQLGNARTVLVLEDLDTAQGRVSVSNALTTLE